MTETERLLWAINTGRETLPAGVDYTVADLRRWVRQYQAVALMLGARSVHHQATNLLPRSTP